MPAIMKPSRLSCAIQTEAAKGGGLTTISSFALFDFADPRRLLTEQALWPMVAEQMPKGAVFDKGKLKPKGEFIIAGAALAPTDRPITGARVTARLGTIEKKLAVFGDRFWRLTDRGIEMFEAKPFDRIPIDEAHAFGGPNHKTNPRGKGHAARRIVESGYDAPLPNVEDAQRLIRSIDDNPPPAHFGPIAPDDTGRLRYAGTYDQHWIKNVSPLKPEDFNPLFYCDAPEDQRLDAYFKGDEGFMVSGMSRGEAAVGGRLPNLRARAFVHRPQDGSFTEIRMVCDTVTLFPNVTKAALAFRGVAKSEDRFGDDLGTVMLALEFAEDAPRPQDHYLHVFRLRSDPAQAHKHVLSDFQLMPETDPDDISERRRQKLEKARQDRIRFLENQNWAARKAVQDAGMSPDIVPPVDPNAIDDLPLIAQPTSEEIERGDLDIAALIDDVEALQKAMQLKSDMEMAKAELQRRAIVKSVPRGALPETALTPIVDDEHLARFPDLHLDDDMEAAFASLETTIGQKSGLMEAMDKEFAGPGFAGLPAEIERAFDMVDSADRVDPEAADGQFRIACARALKLPEGSPFYELLTAFDAFSGDRMDVKAEQASGPAGFPRFGDVFAALKDKKLPPPKDWSFDRDTMFRNKPFTVNEAPGQEALKVAGEKLRKVAPQMIDESAADPIEGLLAKVGKLVPPPDPAEADLTVGERIERRKNAALEQIAEAEPDVDEALATSRRMTPMAVFPVDAFLPGVAERFGSFIAERLAEGHDLKGADLAGASLRNVDFSGLDLASTFFEKADLTGANFSGANLEGAVFTEAVLDSADFSGVQLRKANLSKASLRGTRLDGATLGESPIIEADFSGASLRNIRLSKIPLIKCLLGGADFSGAQIADLQLIHGQADGMKMEGAVIERTAFMMVSLKDASFDGAQLERVVFTGTAAPGVSFVAAQLKSVGFLGDCDLSGGNFAQLAAENTSWNTTRLVESCFLRAGCESCLFNACDMTASDLRLASMKSSRFDKSVLMDSDLFGANLFSASLSQADLRRTSLRGANLYFATLLETKLASSDLSGANLGGTLLEQQTHA